MKISINTYSFLWTESIENTLSVLADNGLKSVELLISPPHFNLSKYKPGMYLAIKRLIEKYNMEILALNIPGLDINLASPFPEMREMSINLYKRLVDINQELEAKILLIAPGKRHPLLPPCFDFIYQYSKKSIEVILEYGSHSNLIYGIETLPSIFLDTSESIKSFIDDLDHQNVKMVIDVANVFQKEDVCQSIRKYIDYLCLIHLSDTKVVKWEHNVIGTGDVDFGEIVNTLNEIRYDGEIVLEVINDKGIEGIMKSIDILKNYGLNINL
ncbi:sugar phosphate isomerase/epimerase family protein [Desulfitibacter alkalitolerans]|uniref:sugar phosphate isomerase/epimerase family protein n=1 Tax=Desulfitibacter alkalitolerans TaxID=264641 RepID=UPI0004820BB7|nr:sugar phosphate isomerase/epimerase family protein [Desulfitibacter alkalitolerans]